MKKWFRLPLQEKLKYLTFSAGAVVFLSIAANMLVAFFGLGGFGSILKDNSQSLAFWASMDEESAAFDLYAKLYFSHRALWYGSYAFISCRPTE